MLTLIAGALSIPEVTATSLVLWLRQIVGQELARLLTAFAALACLSLWIVTFETCRSSIGANRGPLNHNGFVHDRYPPRP